MDTALQVSIPSSRVPSRPCPPRMRLVMGLALVALALPAMAVPPEIGLFFQAGSRDEGESRRALGALARDWDNAYAGMILDIARTEVPSHLAPEASDISGAVSLQSDEVWLLSTISPPLSSGQDSGSASFSPRWRRE